MFHLVRHAAHDNVGGFLAGRTPGIRLGPAGRAQAGRVARRIARETVDAIYASPRERTQETAQAIGTALGLSVETSEALDEIDFGVWSGRTFDALSEDWHWRRWNAARALTRTPNGEAMRDAQRRILDLMDDLVAAGAGHVVLVTHADPIKSALAYYLGLPLGNLAAFDIAPGSLSTIERGDWNARVLLMNEVPPEAA